MASTLETLGPILVLLSLGFGSVRARWLDDAGVRALVFFVFSLAIPSLLFRSLAGIELPIPLDPTFMLAYYGGTLATYGVGMAVGRLAFGAGLASQAIFGMSASYSNLVMMGIPIIVTALGQEALLPLLVILSVHGATLMPLTVALIQTGRGGGSRGVRQVVPVLAEVLRNPIILGILAGVASNLTGLGLWRPIDHAVELLAETAVPCALFAMGASMAGYPLKGRSRPALALTAAKLVLHPLLVWIAAGPLLGLEGIWLTVPVLLAGMPSAVNAYLFGARYEVSSDVAARTVLLSTVGSMATIAVLLALVS